MKKLQEQIQEHLKNPIYLILIVLIAILMYFYLNEYFYDTGEKIGKELILSYNK